MTIIGEIRFREKRLKWLVTGVEENLIFSNEAVCRDRPQSVVWAFRGPNLASWVDLTSPGTVLSSISLCMPSETRVWPVFQNSGTNLDSYWPQQTQLGQISQYTKWTMLFMTHMAEKMIDMWGGSGQIFHSRPFSSFLKAGNEPLNHVSQTFTACMEAVSWDSCVASVSLYSRIESSDTVVTLTVTQLWIIRVLTGPPACSHKEASDLTGRL